MKKIFTLLAAALLLTACQESLNERAAREARSYTQKNCPARMGEWIIMDSMAFEAPTRTMAYYYRFTGVMDTTSAIRPDEMREQLLGGLRNSTSMKLFKDNDFSFRYVYRSERNPDQVLLELKFEPKDYR